MSANNPHPCTGVILAGGLNTRFSGRDKAFLKIGGKTILERILDVFTQIFKEIILVSNNPLLHLDRDVDIVTDLLPIRSSLTGIHTGLFYSTQPFVFCSGCDAPFLKKELVETILTQIRPGMDLLIPETSAGIEPLCAVYAKSCLKRIERHLLEGKCKIGRVFKKNRMRKIPEERLRADDPHLISFFNVNTPEDLMEAEKLTGLTPKE